MPPGPDSNLYYGLGLNIFNGTGFVDNIRNDEILPSVGFPFMTGLANFLGDNDGRVLSYLIYAAFLSLSYLLFHALNLRLWVSIILLSIIAFFLPTTNLWGIELSLAASLAFLFFALFRHFNKQSWHSAFILGLSILISLLIRPTFLPLVFLVSVLCLFLFIRQRRFRKTHLTAFIIFTALIMLLALFSREKYGDTRLLNGTYSSIPLYCAFNPYIELEGCYYSTRWNEISPEQKAEGIHPLKLPEEGWKKRDIDLKLKVVEFIKLNPVKAVKAYSWRLSIYTYHSKYLLYNLFFFAWISALVLALFHFRSKFTSRQKKLAFAMIVIPVYTIAFSSLFPYVGNRYLITPGLSLFFSAIILFWLVSDAVSAKSEWRRVKFKRIFIDIKQQDCINNFAEIE